MGMRTGRWLGGMLAAFAALAAPALGRPAPTLSPRLAALTGPALRSASHRTQARGLSLPPSGPGSLLRRGNRLLVDVRFGRGAAASLGALRAAGAQIVYVSRSYQTVTVASTPASLAAIAAVAGVRGVREDLAPITYASAACPSGEVVSEGDTQLKALEARTRFHVDGAGVTVGLLSDSFNRATYSAEGTAPIATHAAEDVASGDLPGAGNPCHFTTPVNVLEDSPFAPGPEGPADEGRAMAQIVHDLAPGASLAFATADGGEYQFAANIERLAEPVSRGGAGARVIADDVAYLEEPFFQEGPVAHAISEVASRGVSYLSAAGNDNALNSSGQEIGSWEAPQFRDAGGCPHGLPAYATHCMNFAASGTDTGLGLTVAPGGTVTLDLQWAQPRDGVSTDLDAYLLSGGSVVARSEEPNANPAVQEPIEVLSWTNPGPKSQTVELAIDRCAEACGAARAAANPPLAGTEGGDAGTPRLKFVLLDALGAVTQSEYPASGGGDTVGPTIFGHAGGSAAIGVAAVNAGVASAPEPYSSRGPVTNYFGPVQGTSAAARLSTPQTLSKPDIAATDCVATTFFAEELEPGRWRFCGTSAAAPHAAAVAALMLEAKPSLTPAQVAATMAGSAVPVGGYGADAVGAGLLDAVNALASLIPPPGAVTGAASAVGRDSATLSGSVDPNGQATTTCRFEWGLAAGSYTTGSAPCGPSPGSAAQAVPVEAVASGLAAGVTYHFRVVEQTNGGEAQGEDAVFTTAPEPPSVGAAAATAVTQDTATVTGSVNPNGAPLTLCTLEWWPAGNPAAAASASCPTAAGTSTTPVEESFTLSGLPAATPFEYRLVAAGPGGGPIDGQTGSFTTLAETCQTNPSLCQQPAPVTSVQSPAAQQPPQRETSAARARSRRCSRRARSRRHHRRCGKPRHHRHRR